MNFFSKLEQKFDSLGYLFLLYFTAWFINSFLLMALFIVTERNHDIDLIKNESAIQLNFQRDLMMDHFRDIASDLSFLPQLNEMLRYREFQNEQDRILVGNEFIEFSRSKNQYDQIRFLNENGDEIVRVNYNNGDPELIPLEELQNKKDRYYFIETLSLDQGEIYVSPFDLNIEFNKIEQPIKPMIRFGTPVFDKSGNKKGIVILNYLGNILLDNLKDATGKNPGVFSLINSDGFWLYNDNENVEWGFIYPDRIEYNFSQQDPDSWNKIISEPYAQFINHNSIMTSIRIKSDLQTVHRDQEFWILMNTIPYEQIGVKWSQILFRDRYVFLVVFILDVLIAFILAKSKIERLHLSSEIKRMAMYDNLTGLPNRYLLYDRVNNEILQSERYNNSFALFYIDLDGFKEVNDSLGHDAGDQLLIKVGELFKKAVRISDTVSRVGGDEFIILVSHVQNIQNCNIVAGKILDTFSRRIDLDMGSVKIGASIGIVISNPKNKLGIEELVQVADSAMYEIKKNHKNGFKIIEV